MNTESATNDNDEITYETTLSHIKNKYDIQKFDSLQNSFKSKYPFIDTLFNKLNYRYINEFRDKNDMKVSELLKYISDYYIISIINKKSPNVLRRIKKINPKIKSGNNFKIEDKLFSEAHTLFCLIAKKGITIIIAVFRINLVTVEIFITSSLKNC